MFSQVSVCQWGGVCPIACWDTPPRPEATPTRASPHRPEADIPLGRHPLGRHPPAQCMVGYGQQAGGTHPTGMHSCFFTRYTAKISKYYKFLITLD